MASIGSITTRIIKDGLVFNMDPANRASYPLQRTAATAESGSIYNTLNLSESGSLISTLEFQSGSYFQFDGADDTIDTNIINLSTTNTISAWINCKNQLSDTVQYLFGRVNNFTVMLYAKQKVYYGTVDGNFITNTISPNLPSDDIWYYFTVTRTNTSFSVYANGEFKTTKTDSGLTSDTLIYLRRDTAMSDLINQ